MTVVETIEKVISRQIALGRNKYIVYPYGPVGYLVKRTLEEKFGINPVCVIDKYKYGTYKFIKTVEFLGGEECKGAVVLLSTHNADITNELMETLKPYADRINPVDVFPLEAGKHSWGPLCNQNGYLIEKIGAFCSFAEGACVVSNHWKEGVSTSALFNGIDLDNLPVFEAISDHVPLDKLMDNKRCVIGNDVWLGRNVIVCNGAKIGNGVIAAAGAVITKDIPDYAVVGGAPARILKYRFNEKQIERLQKIKWWEWPDEKIAEHYKEFYDINTFLDRNTLKSKGDQSITNSEMENKEMKNEKELDVAVRTKKDIYQFSSIVLWGAGFAFEDCVDSIGREHIKAVFDNDESKWGKEIAGFEIKSPKTDFEQYVDEETAIVISTNGYESEIATGLIKEKGVQERQLFSNSNSVVETYRYKPETILQNMERIYKVKELLADEASKVYYMNFIKACLTRNPLYLQNNPCSTDTYEYTTASKVIGFDGIKVILDCGAYNGDTARLFMEKTKNNCEIYCFEPVVENYHELQSWITEAGLTNIHAIHSGVGNAKYTDQVFSTEEKTTKAAVGGNRFQSDAPIISEIQVDTLDNMVPEVPVDYIKMDIEGAEMSALEGAKNTIVKNNPQMLISAYHKIEDMWEIPEFVLQLNKNYEVYLGHQPYAPYEPEFIFISK